MEDMRLLLHIERLVLIDSARSLSFIIFWNCCVNFMDNSFYSTVFLQMQKLEPWLVSGVNVIGGVDTISILAKGLPVSNDLDLGYDVEHLKAPPTRKKRLVMLIGVFSTGNNFERRMALRKSWMQYEAVRSGEVAVRFFIGLVSAAVNWK